EDGDSEVIVRCPVDRLEVGATVSVLVTFAVDAGAAGQELCNEAIVGSGSLDPEAADNESVACSVLDPAPGDPGPGPDGPGPELGGTGAEVAPAVLAGLVAVVAGLVLLVAVHGT